MQKFPRRWDKITCINYLQRKIILNCIAYYYRNTNGISDKDYDEISKQLVELQKTVDVRLTQYGYIFYDFDGSTGFDLYDRLTEDDKKYMNAITNFVFPKSNNKHKKKKGGLF